MSTGINNAGQLPRSPYLIDNTDWLKVAAIILVSIDHTGYFFIDDDRWWSTVGRLAAPVFFFLMGFAQTRKLPYRWIILGVTLTLLDSWNNEWTWVAPNILLSFALIRIFRPYVQILAQRYGWFAFIFFLATLVALLPFVGNVADYGAEGWLWALFGFYQRMYVDRNLDAGSNNEATNLPHPPKQGVERLNVMRLLTCITTAIAYLWQEQLEFNFTGVYYIVFIIGVCFLCVILCLFRRGPSRIQLPKFAGIPLRLISQYTLEIYAIQLAGFEIILQLFPALTA